MTPSAYGKARAVGSCALRPQRAWGWGVFLALFLLPLGARGDVSPEVRRYLVSIHQLIEDLDDEPALVGPGAATGMDLLGAPEPPAPLRFGLDGTSVFVSGRLP